MAFTLAGFRTEYPEFTADHSDDAVTAAIKQAAQLHSVTTRGQMLATAHLLALRSEHTAKPDGGSGLVTGETLGPQSFTFQQPAKGESLETWWATTSYGRQLMALESRTPRLRISAKVVA